MFAVMSCSRVGTTLYHVADHFDDFFDDLERSLTKIGFLCSYGLSSLSVCVCVRAYNAITVYTITSAVQSVVSECPVLCM